MDNFNSKIICKSIKFPIFTLLFLSFCLGIFAQKVSFTTLGRKDGLPTKTIFHLLEDKQGFIWAGTADGLCRYDGYSFKVWRGNLESKYGLRDKFILSLLEDNNGNLWVGTRNGSLSMFNSKNGNWMYWKTDSLGESGPQGEYVDKLSMDKQGRIWFISKSILHEIYQKNGDYFFRKYKITAKNSPIKKINVYFLYHGSDDKIWLGTQVGLVEFSKGEKKFDFGKQTLNENREIYVSIATNERGEFFVAKLNGGIGIIKKANMRPGVISDSIPGLPEYLKNNQTRRLKYIRSLGIISLGNGLVIIKEKRGNYTFERYIYNPRISGSIPDNYTKDLITDKVGNWWLASEDGISRHFPVSPKVSLLTRENIGNDLFDNQVARIYQDSDNKIWTGSGYGMYRYDEKNGKLDKLIIPGADENSPGYVGGIIQDKNGNIWAAVSPWLYCIDTGSLKWKRFPVSFPVASGEKHITWMLQDESDNIWLSVSNGLTRFNPKSKTWRTIVLGFEDIITQIASLDQDYLIASGSYNLFKINKNTFKSQIIEKDVNDSRNTKSYFNLAKGICIENKCAYIPTIDGLMLFDFKSSSWDSITTDDGLPTNYLRAVISDNQGKIWISSNEGICFYDPKTQKISILKTQTELPCIEFTSRSVFRGNSGRLFFGCTNGLIAFYPSDITIDYYVPKPIISDFLIFNQSISQPVVGTNNDFILSDIKSVSNLRVLTLNHTHSLFTIEFTSLNYFNTHENKYFYRLVGFDDKWIDNGNNNFATFTNLNPGSYFFEVKASNHAGVWGSDTAVIKIIILPPWYRTLIAYVIYAILVVLILYGLFYLRMRNIRRILLVEQNLKEAKIAERETFRKKLAADFHDEAGNRITKINLLTNLAMGNINGNIQMEKYLSRIEENTKELSSGMRDFLWVLDPVKDTLYETITRIQSFGDSILPDAKIKFNISGLNDEFHSILLPMEYRKNIIQIFKEGLHNVVKHSKANEVEFNVLIYDYKIEISLRDNGIGLYPESTSNTYGLDFMNIRAKEINADLTISTLESGGVKIHLNFEIPHLRDTFQK